MSRHNARLAGGRISGLDELISALDLMPRESANLARATVHGVAGEYRDRMRKRVRAAGIGKNKTLEKALFAKRDRSPPDKPSASVHVSKGKGARYDGFYWHWLEWPTRNRYMPTVPYIGPTAAEMAAEMPDAIKRQFDKRVVAMMKRRARSK